MSKFNFKALSRKIIAGAGPTLDLMANNAVNQFKIDNFNAESFIDDSPQRWAPRKSKRDDAGRRLLVKTGRGRESIKVLSKTATTRVVGTEVPYMKFHNEGTKTLPKRQFMGNSGPLERKNKAVLLDYIDKTVRSHQGK